MSSKYLGQPFDIHTGGVDLIFPHHTNEIAQSERCTPKIPFVRYWLHNGLMQQGQQKMSKSIGNLVNIKDALDRFSSDAIRLFILGSHYRSPLTYSEEALEASQKGAERLHSALTHRTKADTEVPILSAQPFEQKFVEAMDDDFNTAQAIAVLDVHIGQAVRVADQAAGRQRGSGEAHSLRHLRGRRSGRRAGGGWRRWGSGRARWVGGARWDGRG